MPTEGDIVNALNLGSSKEALKALPKSPLAQLIEQQVNDIIKKLRDRLIHYSANASTKLAQSIEPTDVQESGSAISIETEAEFYWKFVNYGVNGTLIGRGAPHWGTQPKGQKSFKQMIDEWIRNRGITTRPNQSYESLNFAIRKSVIEKGKEPRPFFTDVVNQALERELTEQVTQLMGRAIEIVIIDPWR